MVAWRGPRGGGLTRTSWWWPDGPRGGGLTRTSWWWPDGPRGSGLTRTSWLGLSQLCSVFDQLCYSIMLHFLINYASKRYQLCFIYDQLFHKDRQFYKVWFKNVV